MIKSLNTKVKVRKGFLSRPLSEIFQFGLLSPALPPKVYQITKLTPINSPSWQFLQRPFLGLSKQTAGPGSGLIFSTLLCLPLLSHRHNNGNRGPPKETDKGRQVFTATAICQFSWGPFQGWSGIQSAAGEGPAGEGTHITPRKKQSQCEKNQREGGAWMHEWRAPRAPPLGSKPTLSGGPFVCCQAC